MNTILCRAIVLTMLLSLQGIHGAMAADSAKAFFSLASTAEVDPAAQFPIAEGTKWVYAHQYKTTPQPGVEISIAWTSEEEVRQVFPLNARRIVLKKLAVKDIVRSIPKEVEANLAQWYGESIPATAPVHLVVEGNYVYEMPEEMWDDTSYHIATAFREALEQGRATPLLFFPLGGAAMWAEREREAADWEVLKQFEAGEGPAPNPGMYYWVYSGVEDLEVPWGKVTGAHRVAYRATGGVQTLWIKEGIGIVRRVSQHQGTHIEEIAELVAFEAAKGE